MHFNLDKRIVALALLLFFGILLTGLSILLLTQNELTLTNFLRSGNQEDTRSDTAETDRPKESLKDYNGAFASSKVSGLSTQENIKGIDGWIVYENTTNLNYRFEYHDEANVLETPEQCGLPPCTFFILVLDGYTYPAATLQIETHFEHGDTESLLDRIRNYSWIEGPYEESIEVGGFEGTRIYGVLDMEPFGYPRMYGSYTVVDMEYVIQQITWWDLDGQPNDPIYEHMHSSFEPQFPSYVDETLLFKLFYPEELEVNDPGTCREGTPHGPCNQSEFRFANYSYPQGLLSIESDVTDQVDFSAILEGIRGYNWVSGPNETTIKISTYEGTQIDGTLDMGNGVLYGRYVVIKIDNTLHKITYWDEVSKPNVESVDLITGSLKPVVY